MGNLIFEFQILFSKRKLYIHYFHTYSIMNNFNNSSLQNVICLDIVNVTDRHLNNWLLANNTYEEITKEYLFQVIENNKNEFNESNKIGRIYLHNSFCIATSYQDNLTKLELAENLLDEIKELPTIKTGEMKTEIDGFMKNLIENHRMTMSEITYLKLNKYVQQNLNPIKYKIPFFFEDIICFEMYSFDLKMKDITSSSGFKPIYEYLRKKHIGEKIIKNLIIQKMYYLKDLLIAFSAKLNGTDEEIWFWSEYYTGNLHYIKPTYLLKQKTTISLDTILDKINCNGINSLDKEEIEFLENFK
jgi:hypothetical protein